MTTERSPSKARARAMIVARAALVLGVALLFWVPAWGATRPFFPAPLDDVYIYFDFARSTAKGCVLCWTPETGYSTGATSPLWALVLAPGYLVGFRGAALGYYAAAATLVLLFDLTGSLARLTPDRPRAGLAAAALAFALPLLDWSLVSGMESALVACLIGRALVAVRDVERAPADRRAQAQLRAGAIIALVGLVRPECLPFAFALAVAVGHASRSLRLAGSLARAALPLACSFCLMAVASRAFTGEWQASGALRKLVTTDPHATETDVAVLVVVNALRLYTVGFDVAFGSPWAARALVVLALGSLVSPKTRRLGAALVFGAVGAFALVLVNKTAPYQNLRYLVPTWIMLLIAAGLALGQAARASRGLGVAAGLVAALVVASAGKELHHQIDHFRRSSKNIAEQQVEVGRRLRAMSPRPRRVLVGDAGAIPYVSELEAIDGLGLGGHHDLPFARASVEGVGAVVELIERLDPEARPDALAIYDAWWPDLGATFGRRAFSVKIEDNVICADPEKVVYRADWSALEDRRALEAGAVFRLDVADLVDEKSFDVKLPGPRGGYVLFAVKRSPPDDRAVFDAERLLAEGQAISFALPPSVPSRGSLELIVTTDSEPGRRLTVTRAGRASITAEVEPHAAGDWGEARAEVVGPIPGERIELVATGGPLKVGSIRAVER